MMKPEFDDHEVDEDEDDTEQPPSHNSSRPTKLRYRECLKNHAVGLGGHALDGCGEFMPAGADDTLDALKCAACNCHRNFHRKEDATATATTTTFFPPAPQFSPFYHPRGPSGYLHVAGQHRMLALPSTSGGGREETEDGGGSAAGRKRFRTKFTAEQKERMVELAEKVGWRIQKHDEEAVERFCDETGVRRHVLKVWMHNNKHTLGKLP